MKKLVVVLWMAGRAKFGANQLEEEEVDVTIP